MRVGRVALVSLLLTTGAGLAWADQATEAVGGRSPLPHPDIIPPETAKPASASPLAGTPVPAARTAASDRSGISDAANNIAAPAPAEQDKEIAHRSAPAGAAPTNGPNGANVPRRGMGGLSLISGLWPLLMVLAVIGGVAVFVKKYMPTNRLLLGSEVLRIVARTSLGSKQHLVLVKLGRRLVLLGVAPERISALSTVEDPDQVAMLLGEAASTRPDSMTQAFAASIGQESAAFDTEDADEDATAATHGHVQGLLSKVRQLTGKT